MHGEFESKALKVSAGRVVQHACPWSVRICAAVLSTSLWIGDVRKTAQAKESLWQTHQDQNAAGLNSAMRR